MKTKFTHINLIFYVENQETSTVFYSKLLHCEPTLNVPGMTEFELGQEITLGLMPNKGINRLLGDKIQSSVTSICTPRAELYLRVENLENEFNNAVLSGATLLSEISYRDWGDDVCYFADPDGYIIAFARQSKKLL